MSDIRTRSAWSGDIQRSRGKNAQTAFLRIRAVRPAVGRFRRLLDRANGAVGFQDRHEHDEAQNFGGEYGDGYDIIHVSTRSVRLDDACHTLAERSRLCPDCRGVVICCRRRDLHCCESVEGIALVGVGEGCT